MLLHYIINHVIQIVNVALCSISLTGKKHGAAAHVELHDVHALYVSLIQAHSQIKQHPLLALHRYLSTDVLTSVAPHTRANEAEVFPSYDEASSKRSGT
jgi:hypothetical protein